MFVPLLAKTTTAHYTKMPPEFMHSGGIRKANRYERFTLHFRQILAGMLVRGDHATNARIAMNTM